MHKYKHRELYCRPGESTHCFIHWREVQLGNLCLKGIGHITICGYAEASIDTARQVQKETKALEYTLGSIIKATIWY